MPRPPFSFRIAFACCALTAATASSATVSNERAREILRSADAFWQANASQAGIRAYVPISPLRLRERDEGRVICDAETLSRADAADNAVAHDCAEGPAIVWDKAHLGDLAAHFGEPGVAILLSHEFGHVIANQAGIEGTTSLGDEQYADCLSGVRVAASVRDGLSPFEDPGAIDQAVGLWLFLSDAYGDSPTDKEAHGLGFDRLRAFQEGYDGSVNACSADLNELPPIVERVFVPGIEAARKGNRTFVQASVAAKASLSTFFGRYPKRLHSVAPLVSSRSVGAMRSWHRQIGDAATFTVFAEDTFAASQQAAGRDPADPAAILDRACWVGVWLARAQTSRSGGLHLSPGDLDEALQTYVRLSRGMPPGTLFARTSRLRRGFFEGAGTCQSSG